MNRSISELRRIERVAREMLALVARERQTLREGCCHQADKARTIGHLIHCDACDSPCGIVIHDKPCLRGIPSTT